MANPTTNYSFVLPTSSDLVTDLPADFDVALQGVDTRLKALQPGTTLGDLAYSSATANTNTRLGVGTTGQVLTVAGGVPTWAAPAGGSATSYALINTGGTALTGAGTITVSGLSGYNKLFVKIDAASSASAGAEIFLRLNTATSNYAQNQVSLGATTTYAASNLTVGTETIKITLAYMSSAAGSQVRAICNIDGANSSGIKTFMNIGGATGGGGTDQFAVWGGGTYTDTNVISSVSILTSAGNFDNGTIFIYGAN